MKPEQIYQELKDLAEKLGIHVSEQNFRTTGIAVKSGLCKVKGQPMLIVDKHKSIRKKIGILTSLSRRQLTAGAKSNQFPAAHVIPP